MNEIISWILFVYWVAVGIIFLYAYFYLMPESIREEVKEMLRNRWKK